MDSNTTYSDLFSIFIKKSKLFIVIGFVSITASVIFSSSSFISPKYKSELIIYPSNLWKYSDESETDQLLQLCFGNDIRDSIIDKFDLIDHYDIDTSSQRSISSLNKEYNDNVSIKKTKYESINIVVFDTDPIIARDIAQEIIVQLNIKIRRLHQIKTREVVVIRKKELDNRQEFIDILEDEIEGYSIKYGLLDYTEQSREVTFGYINMLLENKKGESMHKVEDLYKNLVEGGSHFKDLHEQLRLAREDHNKKLVYYDEAVVDLQQELTYTNVVVFPEVADKKSYPVRWLIVVLSFLGSILFSFMLLLFNYRLNKN